MLVVTWFILQLTVGIMSPPTLWWLGNMDALYIITQKQKLSFWD